MLSVKVMCKDFTQVFTVDTAKYRTHFQENIDEFVSDHGGETYLYFNYDGKGKVPPSFSFISIMLKSGDDVERYIILAPAWVYIMNESGKTIDQIVVSADGIIKN